MNRARKRYPQEYILVMRDKSSDKYRTAQVDIDGDTWATARSNNEREMLFKKVRTLVVNYPDFINCEILSIEPIDEMGYFKVKSKIVLMEG